MIQRLTFKVTQVSDISSLVQSCVTWHISSHFTQTGHQAVNLYNNKVYDFSHDSQFIIIPLFPLYKEVYISMIFTYNYLDIYQHSRQSMHLQGQPMIATTDRNK